MNNINSETIESPQLHKSKLYLKIIRLPFMEKGPITPDIIKDIIKETHIFNNIALASKPHVMKASAKSNIVVVWINIWNLQSVLAAKNIINWYFNVGQYIIIVYSTNMNPVIPQYKNYWKWGYSTLSCCSHVSRYAKYNGVYTTKYHRENAWCCKENKNFTRVATKGGEPCLHVFKCANYKGDHQADSYTCPFWHNCFNRD